LLVVFLLGLAVPGTFLVPLLLLWGGLLGLAVVAWSSVHRGAWPAWAGWLALGTPAVDAAAVFGVLVVVPGALYCGGAERAVLAAFSQYRGATANAAADLETGMCTVASTTSDPAGAVVADYRAQLTAGVGGARWQVGGRARRGRRVGGPRRAGGRPQRCAPPDRLQGTLGA